MESQNFSKSSSICSIKRRSFSAAFLRSSSIFSKLVKPHLQPYRENEPGEYNSVVIRKHVIVVVEYERRKNMKHILRLPSVLNRSVKLHGSPPLVPILYRLKENMSRTIFYRGRRGRINILFSPGAVATSLPSDVKNVVLPIFALVLSVPVTTSVNLSS